MAGELAAKLRSEIEALKSSIATVKKDIADIDSEISEVSIQLQKAVAAGNTGEASALRGRIRDLTAEEQQAKDQLASYQQQLAQAQYDLQQAETAAAAPDVEAKAATPTAAQTVKDDATPNPAKPPPLEVDATGRVVTPPQVAPTNADTVTTGSRQGLETPPVTYASTQAAPAEVEGGTTGGGARSSTGFSTTNALAGSSASAGASASSTTGEGAQDDAASVSPTSTSVNVDNGFNNPTKIEPQPNILGRFTNYTYSASVYLLSASQYQDFVKTKKKKVNGYNLLFQSGGAPINVGGVQGKLSGSVDATGGSQTEVKAPGPDDPDAGRNPYFQEDFYIDSISLESTFPGKQTSAAHMASNLKFTVIEPAGITLIDRIYQAVQDNAPTDATGAVNYTAAQYLMVIRFYGYDDNGKIVRLGATGPDGLSDPNAVVEKYIPFIIRSINWSVANRLVTYEFDCAPVGQLVGGTTARGTVPYDIELRESTVGGLLAGAAAFSTTTPAANAPGASTTPAAKPTNTAASPATANAAPKPKTVLTGGLVDAMNKFQQELVDVKKVYEQPDTYEVVFAKGAEIIRDAKITLPGAVKNKSSTPMASAPDRDPNSKDPARQRVVDTAKKVNITAGQQMLQIIDQAIRNSSFIYNQAALQNSEKAIDAKKLLEDEGNDTSKDNKVPKETTVLWYQITMEATPKKVDYKRNDYSYNIRYIISVYPVQNFNSKYYPIPKFRGIHKQYRYWFTGENIDVLDYTANFNGLYQMTVSGREPNNNSINQLRQKYMSSMRELPKYVYSSASDQTRQGAEAQANEIAANAAEALYSPSDLANCKLRILGDPAWIQQGSTAFGIDPININYSPFLPDGTINFDAEQCLFAIEWQRPVDYSRNTGMADPYRGAKLPDRKPINSVVYQATKCVSEFRQGRFEQMIDGTIYLFPVPQLTNAASQPSTTVGETGSDQRDQTAEPAGGVSTATKTDPGAVNNTQTATQPDTNTTMADQAVAKASVSAATDGLNNQTLPEVVLPVPERLPNTETEPGSIFNRDGIPPSVFVPTNQTIVVEP